MLSDGGARAIAEPPSLSGTGRALATATDEATRQGGEVT